MTIPALTSVTSSNITAVGYSEKTLFVKFKQGEVYSYDGVSPKTYQSFINAPSKGIYFSKYILGKYISKPCKV